MTPRTIALVGMDGSGKTTQAHRLADELRAAGVNASYRRNAGGRHWFGRVAVRLGRADADDLLGRRTMLFVEAVLRWLAILRTLLRRAFTGGTVVMDRYAYCQYASLRARGAKPAAERRARLAYRFFPRPDVTFLLDVTPEVAHDRIEARGYDSETMDYLASARAAYHSLPELAGFVVIDANGTPDEVSAAIHTELARRGMPAPGRSVRGMILAGGPLVAALAVAGYQLAEAL
ncbi:dTMP kinase [Paractinoplanes lichenicola]|uniref:Thymidylate kinase n=1 Tax=Paractinoplanes lichenicola TaxID=2802976 RepID=A0ABS1W116_9ACTN|nr:thymidylate kinase [Actinoplanes lichenicola]MBL7260410.1 thymidylate kinase [Actinoplanes lichenicola]